MDSHGVRLRKCYNCHSVTSHCSQIVRNFVLISLSSVVLLGQGPHKKASRFARVSQWVIPPVTGQCRQLPGALDMCPVQFHLLC